MQTRAQILRNALRNTRSTVSPRDTSDESIFLNPAVWALGLQVLSFLADVLRNTLYKSIAAHLDKFIAAAKKIVLSNEEVSALHCKLQVLSQQLSSTSSPDARLKIEGQMALITEMLGNNKLEN
jgi:hypothetical protein